MAGEMNPGVQVAKVRSCALTMLKMLVDND